MARAARPSKATAVEKIPRRPTPEFNESNSTMIQAIKEDGFLNVAMRDVNQFGPHAMILLLFGVATLTALALLLPTL